MPRKTIPVLVHVDNFPATQTDNTDLKNISENVEEINTSTSSIKTSSANSATQLGTLSSSIGLPADESTATTVIGLLKSIVNKLS